MLYSGNFFFPSRTWNLSLCSLPASIVSDEKSILLEDFPMAFKTFFLSLLTLSSGPQSTNIMQVWWFEGKWPSKRVSQLGFMVFLELTQPYRRKCAIVKADFKVLYILKPRPRSQYTSCCLCIKMDNNQLLLQHHVCMHATNFHKDYNRLNL